MSFQEIIARRPVGASLVAIGIILMGALACAQLPIALLPTADAPTITVAASLPGASPKTIAATVAAPLERQLGRIAGVTELTSYSIYGRTAITVQFELGRNIDHAANDVQAAINAAGTELPKDLSEPPTFAKDNPTAVPLLHLALTSDTLPLESVSNWAETVVAQKLAAVEGVASIDVDAAAKPAVRVRVNPAALSSLGLGWDELRTSIAAATADRPKGSLNGAMHAEMIGDGDKPHDADGYRSLVIASRDRSPVHLGEVATVLDDRTEPHAGGWLNGHPAVFVVVMRKAGANLVDTTARIRSVLQQLEHWLPAGIKISVLSDRSAAVRTAVRQAWLTWAETVVLVAAAIALFVGRSRASLIPVFISLVAASGSLIALALLHYSLDVISLTALTIAMGLVVHEPFVMVDSVVRKYRARPDPHPRPSHVNAGRRSGRAEPPALEAALCGARETSGAILAMAAAFVAALLPLLFAPGIAGRVTEEVAVGLGMAVVLSAALSLTVVPALCGQLVAGGGGAPSPCDSPPPRPSRLLTWYAGSLRWALRNRGSVLALIFLTYGATAALYVLMPAGFVPPQDSGVVWGTTEAAADASAAERGRHTGEAARIIMTDPAVADVAYAVSDWGDWLSVNLTPVEQRKASSDDVIARIEVPLAQLPGVKTFLQPAQDLWLGGRQGHGQYQYSLLGENVDELNRWVPIVRDRLLQLPELTDVGTYRADQGIEARLQIDRDRAAALGISPQDIGETLYNAFGQRQLATIHGAVDQVPVVLESAADRSDPAVLGGLSIKSADEQVSLGSIARTDFAIAPIAITRQGQLPYVTLTFNLSRGTSLSQAVARIRAAEADVRLPMTIWGRFDSNAKAFEASSKSRPLLILASAIVVYLVLGILVESYAQPLTVLATLPFAAFGAALALLACGLDLSLVAFIGIAVLAGLCSKGSIMLIDGALRGEREHGLPAAEAVIAASMVQFRPILAITATAMLGALPLAFGTGVGSELQRPLGIVVAGGVIVAQVATLYMTPVIYLQLARWRRACPAPKQAGLCPPAQALAAGRRTRHSD